MTLKQNMTPCWSQRGRNLVGLEFRYVRNIRQIELKKLIEVLTVRPPCVLSWNQIARGKVNFISDTTG